MPAQVPITSIPAVTSAVAETWEIGGNMMYGPQSVVNGVFFAVENELEEGRIVSKRIVSYDLGTRELKTIFELPTDRLVEDAPAVYGNLIVWSSVDRIEEESQRSVRRAPLPNLDVFLLDIETGSVQQITFKEHAQTSPRIFGDTVVWLDARNVEGYYNPRRYDVCAYDIKTKMEKRFTSAPTAEDRDLSIYGNLVVWTDDRHADPPMDIHAGNERGFNNEIYAYDLAANKEIRITDYPGNDRYPAIDGDNIIWLRQLYQDYIKADVFLYNLAAGWETQISNSGYAAHELPSINGNRIVWSDAGVSLGNTAGDTVMNGIQGQSDIFLYDLETHQEIQLTVALPGEVLANPVIYGDYVVYTSVMMTGSKVYTLRLAQ